jgi:hypothetical protein
LLLCILLWKGQSSVFPIVLSFCPSKLCGHTEKMGGIHTHMDTWTKLLQMYEGSRCRDLDNFC